MYTRLGGQVGRDELVSPNLETKYQHPEKAQEINSVFVAFTLAATDKM